MSVSVVVTERLARMGLAAIGAPSTDDPVQVWESLLAEDAHPSLARRAAELDLDQVVTATEAAGARFVVPGDDEWPAGLAALGQDQPLGLWVAGESLLALMDPEADLIDYFARDPEHWVAMRDKGCHIGVREMWDVHGTWKRWPILLDRGLIALGQTGLQVVEGRTRVGVLRGRSQRGLHVADHHLAWVGRAHS